MDSKATVPETGALAVESGARAMDRSSVSGVKQRPQHPVDATKEET